jgi:hypothetical protein
MPFMPPRRRISNVMAGIASPVTICRSSLMSAASLQPQALRAPSDRARRLASRAGVVQGAVLSPAQERARKRLVWTVMIVYLLVIFEGAIRKYIAPQLGQYIFFVRDPFVIYAYALAFKFALWPRNQAWCSLSFFLCGFGVLLFFLQVGVFGLDNIRLIMGVYGWRS